MSQFMRNKAPIRRRFWGREFLILLSSAVFLVLIMLGVVAKQTTLRDTGYLVTQLREETTWLEEQNRRLRGELANLTSPDSLWSENIAMGLTPLGDSSRIQLHLIPVGTAPTDDTMLASKEP